MDDRIPETQPSGALVPPPRVPPTAVATSAPLPPRGPGGHAARVHSSRTGAGAFLAAALDELDRLGDGIAGALGIH
jgi:hypothetical protein